MRNLTFLILLSAINLCAQKKYPKDQFRAPLDIPLLLSGTFGELRSNHFHSGVDIKTQQREGLPVISVGDGYISRIKISPWGFGKALYVAHPEGNYTSVYAHVQKFSPKIQVFIKKLQYQRETYELEVFPEAGEFKVAKGEQIAFSGNTGSSGGPHLHFELRDASQRPINPLHFGMDISDSKAPTVVSLFGYSIDANSQVNQSNTPVEINLNRKKGEIFVADKIFASGKIGFGVNAFDNQDYTYNKNGIYALEMYVNGTLYFSYDFEKFSFSETRYINAFIDYERYKTLKQRVQKCFIAPKNPLSIYNHKVDDGILDIKEGLQYQVEIRIKDFKNNESIIQIPVEGKELETIQKTDIETTPYFLRADIDNNYEFSNASVFFPAKTFYENLYLQLSQSDSTLTIHNDKVPAHKNFTLSFDVKDYDEEKRRKLIIARIDENDELIYSNTSKNGNQLRTKTKDLGVYKLALDTVPPKITPANFKEGQWLNDYDYLKLRMKDELSDIATYRATINGKWILMEYDPKKNMLNYDFSDIVFKEEKLKFKIIATDNVGNSTVFTSTFYRKN